MSYVLREKADCWHKILSEFNSTNGTNRNLKCIQTKYKNLKKDARQRFAAEQNQLLQTGGGPYRPSPVTAIDTKIRELVRISVDGATNEDARFDEDHQMMAAEGDDDPWLAFVQPAAALGKATTKSATTKRTGLVHRLEYVKPRASTFFKLEILKFRTINLKLCQGWLGKWWKSLVMRCSSNFQISIIHL